MKIAIAGNLGIGKSTLTQSLASNLDDSRLFGESINDEVLDLFYKHQRGEIEGNGTNIELLNQFVFFNETIIRDVVANYNDDKYNIYDRSFLEHIHVFAKTNLKPSDYCTYLGYQEIFLKLMGHEPYDVTILLRADVNTLRERIAKRGRDCEDGIDVDYLVELNAIYNSDEFFGILRSGSKYTVAFDVSNMDEYQVLAKVLKIIKDYEENGIPVCAG